jgi:hypothetical protein
VGGRKSLSNWFRGRGAGSRYVVSVDEHGVVTMVPPSRDETRLQARRPFAGRWSRTGLRMRSNSWMQSTGQTSTRGRSLMAMQGSAMM